jgi:hypothetical protein
MFRLLVVGVLTLAAAADAPPQVEALKKAAQEVADATIQGDFKKLIECSYPTIVKELGGQEKAIEQAANVIKLMKAQGFTIKSYTLGNPGELLTEGGNVFSVVPTTLELVTPDAKIEAKSYLLGISDDAGKTWLFLDGSGIAKKELRDKLLPPLPEKLKFPEPEAPRITK